MAKGCPNWGCHRFITCHIYTDDIKNICITVDWRLLLSDWGVTTKSEMQVLSVSWTRMPKTPDYGVSSRIPERCALPQSCPISPYHDAFIVNQLLWPPVTNITETPKPVMEQSPPLLPLDKCALINVIRETLAHNLEVRESTIQFTTVVDELTGSNLVA